jgi:hypothetical protein
MRGMFKPLTYLFLLMVVIYLLLGHRSIVGILEIVGTVFIGGGLILTLFAYVCARLSMPRKATDYLPKK